MKGHKFQMVRIGVPAPGARVRYAGETDTSYARIWGLFVLAPDSKIEHGATLSFKVGGQDVFDEDHDIRLLTCGNAVAPNEKFFRFEEHLEAAGSAYEGHFTDPSPEGIEYPYEVKVFLWLVNDKEER